MWICVFEPPAPPTYFRERNLFHLPNAVILCIYHNLCNSPTAAAGLPHLSRKKGECASLLTVFADCDLRFWSFSQVRCFGLRVCVFTTACLVYMYIYISDDIHIYIYLVFVLGRLRLGALARCH